MPTATSSSPRSPTPSDAAAAAVSAQRALIEHDVAGRPRRPGAHGPAHGRGDRHRGRATRASTSTGRRESARPVTAGRSSLRRRRTRPFRASTMRDLGIHRLAGLPEPEHIFQVLADGLPRDFPPLRNTVAMLGNAMRVVIAEDSILLREGVVASARGVGLRGARPVRQRGRPAAARRDAQARRRDRRHPHAADPHRRRASWRHATIREQLPGDRRARPVAVRGVGVRDGPARRRRRGGRLPPQGSRLRPGGVRLGRAARRRGRIGARPGGRQPARRPPPRRRPPRRRSLPASGRCSS